MKEIKGNLWKVKADWLCIPTNGTVKDSGRAVMGAGVAKQALINIDSVELDKVLGRKIKWLGNVVLPLVVIKNRQVVFSFPTKRDWKNDSDLDLISLSCKQLRVFWLGKTQDGSKITVALPRAGCGCGKLNWKVVRGVMQKILPEDDFVVVS